jgi:hypothetical protein
MKFRPRHLILPSLVCQMPMWSTALAQTAAPATPASYGSSPGGSAWYGLVTLTLLVVLVAVVSKSLGPRESVVVVNVDGRFFLVGHTPSNVSLIAELDHYTPPASAPTAAGSGRLASDFAQALTSALRKGGRK